jgi:hypothetical protein
MLEYLKNMHPGNRFEERRLLGECPLTPEEVLNLIGIASDAC